jgi:putative transposase
MPRIPRNIIIAEGYQVHKIWRGHNREWNLETNDEKEAYFNHLNEYLKKQSNELNAFCPMSNHSHEQYDIKNRQEFSNLMRNHHSKYGMFFNRKHNRQGKVAYERPKTCLIESDDYSMTATFYIHANPVRANITKNAANYRWSTHRLYAFGTRDKINKYVKFPAWYMNLGKTPQERQRKYRKLFDAYLREYGLIKHDFLNGYFYGSYGWVEAGKETIKEWIKSRSDSPP